MRSIKLVLLSAFVFAFLALTPRGSTDAHAQVSLGINIGPAPNCPYGYFNYAPYNCAPYGYYGPEWFNNGAFVGAGRWFHGPANFNGHVNNSYDPHHGYHGAMPHRNEAPAHHGAPQNFHGNETHDGHGHVTNDRGHGNDNHGPH